MYSNCENCCGEVNKVCELFFLSAKVLVITGHRLCIPYHIVCLPYKYVYLFTQYICLITICLS